MDISNSYEGVEDNLQKKYGINDVDKAYLAIDYTKKTEFVDRYGRTVLQTQQNSKLASLIEEALTEEIP